MSNIRKVNCSCFPFGIACTLFLSLLWTNFACINAVKAPIQFVCDKIILVFRSMVTCDAEYFAQIACRALNYFAIKLDAMVVGCFFFVSLAFSEFKHPSSLLTFHYVHPHGLIDVSPIRLHVSVESWNDFIVKLKCGEKWCNNQRNIYICIHIKYNIGICFIEMLAIKITALRGQTK